MLIVGIPFFFLSTSIVFVADLFIVQSDVKTLRAVVHFDAVGNLYSADD